MMFFGKNINPQIYMYKVIKYRLELGSSNAYSTYFTWIISMVISMSYINIVALDSIHDKRDTNRLIFKVH